MDFAKAREETIKLYGEDSFTETDEDLPNGRIRRYYVGACPTKAGAYQGFMGFSWEEALRFAQETDGSNV